MAEMTTTGTDISASQTGGATAMQQGSPETTGDTGKPDTTGADHATSQTDGHDSTLKVVYDPAEFETIVSQQPEEIQGQLRALHKELLGDYTKKTQSISQVKKQAELYQQFLNDPHGILPNIAKQLGYDLKKSGSNSDSQNPNKWSPSSGKDPDSWDDVVNYIATSLESKFGSLLNPVIDEFHSVKRDSMENKLNRIDPAWRTYEDKMIQMLQKHPTLSEDPDTLYKLSVPAEVLESRATQRAIAKMEAKAKSGQVAGLSTTTKKPSKAEPKESLSFADAVAFAQKTLADQGINP